MSDANATNPRTVAGMAGQPAPGPGPTLFWFRRDLRLADNPALHAAVRQAETDRACLLPLFVWEPRERRRWAPGAAARWWLWHSLAALERDLGAMGSRLTIMVGDPVTLVPQVAVAAGAAGVVWAAGLDPEERADDGRLRAALRAVGITARRLPSGALLHDPATPMTKQGSPYTVFTPYWRALRSLGEPKSPLPSPDRLPPAPPAPMGVTLSSLRSTAVRPRADGFGAVWRPGEAGAHERLQAFLEEGLAAYAELRDVPAIDGTSRLSPYLHWGEITARQIWHAVAGEAGQAGLQLESTDQAVAPSRGGSGLRASAEAFARQLGWREFAHHLLHHHPGMAEHPLQARYAAFPWRDDPEGLEAWRRGTTGYGLVDAGMRQLWRTGWMHNRVRLVTASFLVKDLLVTWREGEDWFWETLVDADLADNAMGWQWVAGSGADAAPFFRVFNPETQQRRYDPDNDYEKRWLPERIGAASAAPRIVEHGQARARALAAYAAMRNALP